MSALLWIYLWLGAMTAAPLIGGILALRIATRWGKQEPRDRAIETRHEVDEQVRRMNLDVRSFVVLTLLIWPLVWVVTWRVVVEHRRPK